MHKSTTEQLEQDRRSTDPLVIEMRALRQSLDRKHPENVSHLRAMEEKIDRMEGKVDQVLAGFPDGDPNGHRIAHEAMIKAAEKRARFWEDLSVKLAEKGIWAVVGVVAAGFFLWLQSKVQK